MIFTTDHQAILTLLLPMVLVAMFLFYRGQRKIKQLREYEDSQLKEGFQQRERERAEQSK